MKNLNRDIGTEKDGQYYMFKEFLEKYDQKYTFKKIYHEAFNWMNYVENL